ncbi:hypothetical protein LEMLEM_LOCUS13616 [Lemmus lemmus]
MHPSILACLHACMHTIQIGGQKSGDFFALLWAKSGRPLCSSLASCSIKAPSARGEQLNYERSKETKSRAPTPCPPELLRSPFLAPHPHCRKLRGGRGGGSARGPARLRGNKARRGSSRPRSERVTKAGRRCQAPRQRSCGQAGRRPRRWVRFAPRFFWTSVFLSRVSKDLLGDSAFISLVRQPHQPPTSLLPAQSLPSPPAFFFSTSFFLPRPFLALRVRFFPFSFPW